MILIFLLLLERKMSINSHPTLPEFEYVKPSTIKEASTFLYERPEEARPFLGGTDIFVRMRDGIITPRYLVDIKKIPETNEIQFDPMVGLRIGAAVNMNRVITEPVVQEQYPLLAEACKSVASYQLRNRATIAGNVCNASPAGDTIGACLVYGGKIHIHGMNGYYVIPVDGFFLGPGRTTLQRGDVVIAIEIPVPFKGAFGKYIKLGRNRLSDLSIVGVTILGYPDSGIPSHYRFRIALASVAPIPLLVLEAEEFLANAPITRDRLEETAILTETAAIPIDDIRGSAKYRKEMVRILTLRGLNTLWENLKRDGGE